jgi:hypothetical protein
MYIPKDFHHYMREFLAKSFQQNMEERVVLYLFIGVST